MFLSKYWAKLCKIMPNILYLKWQYFHIYHKKLNIKNPKTYAEKLSYLKVYNYNPNLSKLVDKYEVREYVRTKIGEKYLIPLIGLYCSTNEIPWNELPEQYVIKCTHDSESVIIHRSNDGFNVTKAIDSLNSHLKRNMFYYSREYPYKDVLPRIICEKFLDDNGNPPADYKIMCFSGNPYYIIIDIDRFGNHQRDCYDINWNKQDFRTDHPQSEMILEKPNALQEMLNLSSILSKDFPHVRVDFYYVNGIIYFGEMTFFPWGGPIYFKPDDWNIKLGNLIDLSKTN